MTLIFILLFDGWVDILVVTLTLFHPNQTRNQVYIIAVAHFFQTISQVLISHDVKFSNSEE